MEHIHKLASIALLALAVSTPASAGLQIADEAKVMTPVTSSNGTYSSVSGTMRAFRDNPDPEAYASIKVYGDGSAWFIARLNGVIFACAMPHEYDWQYLSAFAGDLSHARFQIVARNGVCQIGSVIERGSRFGSY